MPILVRKAKELYICFSKKTSLLALLWLMDTGLTGFTPAMRRRVAQKLRCELKEEELPQLRYKQVSLASNRSPFGQ